MSQFILSPQIHETAHVDGTYTFFLEDLFSLKRKKKMSSVRTSNSKIIMRNEVFTSYFSIFFCIWLFIFLTRKCYLFEKDRDKF